MGTAVLWVAVLGFALLLNVRCKVVGEINPMQDVELSAEEQRIIGGETANPGQFPFVVAFFYDGRFICTGSIISSTKVVIAAHCVVLNGTKQDANRFFCLYGTTKLSNQTTRTNVIQIAVHPGYSSSALRNDIAILWTDPMKFSDLTKPICLSKTWLLFSQMRTAAGWGVTSTKGNGSTSAPEDLQYVTLRTGPLVLCSPFYLFFAITPRHICATTPDYKPKGVCYGDSGGPFFREDRNKEFALEGISSFVSALFGCGAVLPGSSVFTRVSSYVEWVITTANDSEICTVG